MINKNGSYIQKAVPGSGFAAAWRYVYGEFNTSANSSPLPDWINKNPNK